MALIASAAAAPLAAVAGEALVRPAVAAVAPQSAVMLAAASAGDRVVAVGERGLVILSDDDGKSWRQAKSPVSVTLTALRFADAKRGAAVGHGGVVLVTIDGGQTWQLRLDGREAARLARVAAEASGNAERIAAARLLVEEGADKPFLDLELKANGELMVFGAYGLAFASDDFGASWTSMMSRLDNPEGLHLNAVRARGERIVIAGERGLVLQSDDRGATFRRVDTPYDGSFFAVELPADGEILLAGLRGNVWQSHDRGQSWEQVSCPVPASITGSTLRAGGGVLLASQAGYILEQPAGGSLRAINAAPLPALSQVLQLKDHRLIALSERGVLSLDLQALSKEDVK
jgi:photosystem II stability/assembly factor-like uncharacterized protein